MTEDIERELRGLDADRPLPQAVRTRLEAALLEDARGQGGGTDEAAAALFDALDAPRPIPPATRAALEQALTLPTSTRGGRGRVLLGLAAAVLLVVGAVAALRAGGSQSHRNVAAGPARTVPEAGVPPVLRLPTATTAPATAGVPPTGPPTARRTTTTTWNCGLCARNGATRSPAAAATGSPAGTVTTQPNGAPMAAALTASGPRISTIEPSSGPRRGGTIVTLTGSGFTGAGGVLFGSTAAANFTVVSDTEIRVMTPPSSTAQTVGVSVTYPDGTTTATDGSSPSFRYT